MENFKHVRPPFDSPWYDPGREYSVPNMQGTSGFMYDSRQVEGGQLDESWAEFFDPRPELIRKVVALDDQRELYQAAAYYLGIDPCTEDPGAAQRILDLLTAQKLKLAFYTSGTNPTLENPLQAAIDEMTNRGVAVSQIWDGGGRLMKRYLPSMVYVVPVEGSAFWQDAYVVPYGAWNLENARTFLNWIMLPQGGQQLQRLYQRRRRLRGFHGARTGGRPGQQPLARIPGAPPSGDGLLRGRHGAELPGLVPPLATHREMISAKGRKE
jgi:spermidine/putrescine transport system substrate-binding protein